MRILLTNDDGINARGLHVLARMMKEFGDVTVVAPKYHQSGMSMAVDLGFRPLAYKDLGDRDGIHWAYLDGHPASCVKYGLNFPTGGCRPDVVLSGINHGSNASTGSCYSGTLGAAQEAALNGIPAFGVSVDAYSPEADFTAVERLFPDLFRALLAAWPDREGLYYNINFPALPTAEIKGIRVGHQGRGHWEREFIPWDPARLSKFGASRADFGPDGIVRADDGEQVFMMVGEYVDDENTPGADHHLMQEGYVTLVAHNLYTTDWEETGRLSGLGVECDF